MKMKTTLAKGLLGSWGFTLVELLIAVGITTVAIGMVGSSIFQSLSVRRTWQGDVIAVKEWRHAQSWFASDALNTEATDLIDGAPSVGEVALSWTDANGIPHTATYTLTGSDLIRDVDGVQVTLARNVAAA